VSAPGWSTRILRDGLCLLGGLAVAVAFPPYDLVFLMPVGLAALMGAVRDVRGRTGLWLGLLFGLGFMLPLLRWITIIGVDAWVALSLLEAAFYALMAVGWCWIRPYRWWPFGVAAVWVTGEFLRSHVPFGGLPWGRLAFGVVETPFVSYGRIGGTALIAFLVVAMTAAVVDVVERRRIDRVTGLEVTLVAATVIGAYLVPVGAAGADGTVRVAAVQGNVPGEGMDPFAEQRVVLHNHAEATRDLADQVEQGEVPRPDVVIWPENSTDIDPFTDSAAYDEIDQAVAAIGVPTLVGAVVDGPDEDHVQNMGIVWSPTTGPGQRYVKRHPVPFGEYIPFRSVLTTFISRLDQIPRDFAAGDEPGVLTLGPVVIGDVICFEVAYDGLVRDVVDGGGRLLVVQTNNATYTGTGQLEQQFAISRYRAVETGRTVVVASTNGISGVVSPDGDVVRETAEKTSAVLVEDVTLAGGRTPAMRIGFWVDLGLALLGAMLAGYAYLGLRRRVGRMVA
jgi:apolipoprotein N-acyltransferase